MNTMSSSFCNSYSNLVINNFPLTLTCDVTQKKGTEEKGKDSPTNPQVSAPDTNKRNPGMNKWQPYNYLNKCKIHYYLSQ